MTAICINEWELSPRIPPDATLVTAVLATYSTLIHVVSEEMNEIFLIAQPMGKTRFSTAILLPP